MIKRLRIKFVFVNMAIVTAMLLVIFYLVLQVTGDNLRHDNARAMEMAAQEHLPPGPPGKGPDRMRMPFFVVENTENGLAVTGSNGFFDLSDEELLQELLRLAEEEKEQTGVLPDYNLRFHKVATPIGQKIVFADISGETAAMNALLGTCVTIGAVSFGAFLVISILLSRWAVAPVEKAWNQQRQFVADASHELKTPLAVIMTNTDLLQSREYPAPERESILRGIETSSRQMRSLVEGLLELARADNDSARMQLEPLDFSELVSESLMLFEPMYFEKGLSLEGKIVPGLRIKGSGPHLRQVAEILLDNGMKYSTPGGTVTLTLKKQGGHCLMTVASPGERISKADLTNIFKRFYRIDKARSRDGSYGLGLSIAHSILCQHGGKIWAESIGGINTFFVQLNITAQSGEKVL